MSNKEVFNIVEMPQIQLKNNARMAKSKYITPLENLPDGKALQIIFESASRLRSVQSQITAAAKRHKISIRTASDELTLYIWKEVRRQKNVEKVRNNTGN